MSEPIPANRLRDLLHYEPGTGVFTWKIPRLPGNVRKKSISGYRGIHIDGRRYKCSRLAWLYQTGEWPKEMIDHINRDPSDDRWCNLRDVTRAQAKCV